MSQTRQLAAIMFIDIKGYTAIMEENEALAVAMRIKMNASINNWGKHFDGRVVKFTGDGALCLFNSAISAVHASINIQKDMRTLPDVVPLRIGLHAGDVMMDEADIYGDVVNVASRVESFAVPGCIFVSGRIYEEIKNQPDITTIHLGLFNFTNIKVPVTLYAIANEGIAVPGKIKLQGKGVSKAEKSVSTFKKIALISLVGICVLAGVWFGTGMGVAKAEPIKSIAIMPFKNIGNDSSNEFFSDGITEDILTQISKLNGLNVISYSTTLQLKNANKSAKELGDELNVGYILEGSVRRALNEVRISAQLVDTKTSQNIWAETFDRDNTKIFELQSEIAQYIAKILMAKLSPVAKAILNKKPTNNITAYEYYLKGREHYSHFSKSENELAINQFKNAIQLDSVYALAWAGLGDAYSQRVRLGLDKTWLDSSKVASSNAVRLDPTSSEAYKALANYYFYRKQYAEGKPLLLKAIELNPNNAQAIGNLGASYFVEGQLDEALRWEKKAAILNPKNFVPYYITGWIYRLFGNNADAELWLKKALDLRQNVDVYRELSFTYLAQKKNKEALALAEKVASIDTTDGNNDVVAGIVADMAGMNNLAKKFYENGRIKMGENADNADDFSAIGLARLYALSGKSIDAEILLSRALSVYLSEIKNGSMDDDLRIFIAAIFALQGNKVQAISYLKQAAEANWLDVFFVENNPWFNSLKQEPEYLKIIADTKAKIAVLKVNAEKF